MAALILAGDVGGTKTLLSLFEVTASGLKFVRERRYATAMFKSLEEVCGDFCDGTYEIDAACFGVPGPVIDGYAQASNLPWRMSQQSLADALRCGRVKLINDLCATALGVRHLGPGEYELLNAPAAPVKDGNIAIIAAGTGLGEAGLIFEEGEYYAIASEGGHSSFAPHGDEQIDLLCFLEHEFGHVSWERVVSGPGLVNVYRFLRSRAREQEPQWLRERMSAGDPAAAISTAAIDGRDPVCGRALSMFCAIYGSEAGNLALKLLARGGVFVCGGIAPKILPMLKGGEFMRGFTDKGRLSAILAGIEVRVSLNTDVARLGAARRAAAML